MDNRHMLVIGHLGDREIDAAAGRVGCEVDYVVDADDAVGRIRESRPFACLIGIDEYGLAHAAQIRASFSREPIPLVGLSRRPTDVTFEEAYSAGFDDVVVRDSRAITHRLRHLVAVEPAPIPKSTEAVLVVDPAPDSRLRVARVFRDAGYRVEFAADAETAWSMCLGKRYRIVIVSASVEPAEPEPLTIRAHEAGSSAAWIVHTPPPRIAAMRDALALPNDARVAIHDSFASPETLLFVANDLLNRREHEARASERLLYGTTVVFRPEGRTETDVGYLYNISGGGLYVRTLAPPARGEELWLEFNPPRVSKLVHLEGRTVWSRPFGPRDNATVPYGFGVEVTGGSVRDLQRYQGGYRQFLLEQSNADEAAPGSTRHRHEAA